MKRLLIACALAVLLVMPAAAGIRSPWNHEPRIIPNYGEVYSVDAISARPFFIMAGIAAAIIGNQDRGTTSGTLLQVAGVLCTITWTF